MKDKKLRENLKIEKLEDELWKIPAEHPMKDFLIDFSKKIKENEEEIKILKREIDVTTDSPRHTLGNQIRKVFCLLNELFKYLGIECYEDWEEDLSYKPSRLKMIQVWRIRKLKKKKK